MANHVESFWCNGSYDDLESEINGYCRSHKYNPLSISVIWAAGTYVAFVVVEEVDDAD